MSLISMILSAVMHFPLLLLVSCSNWKPVHAMYVMESRIASSPQMSQRVQ